MGIKITELIAVLQNALEHHGDMDVLCTWESVSPDIDSIYVSQNRRTGHLQLLIDSDGGAYQHEYIFEGTEPFWESR